METPTPLGTKLQVNASAAGKQNALTLPDVLIIDDSPTMRQVVRAVLESIGYRAVEAENGRVALDRLANGLRPRLVICDINMPIMDGLGFLTAFRKLPGHARTPVVLLTSEAKNGKLLEGHNAGVTAWVTKPFSPVSLGKLVQELFPQLLH